ncbi:MAG: hypothetical protein JXA37_10645 [Chloroflexia bacterium]|nr:hypothetical protein [Chloroflexia bacterium]
MPPPPSPFVGSWEVREATLPNGDPAYTGSIEIRRKGQVFELDWDISAGRYVGIGLLVDAHLFVSCGEQRAGLGIARFQVQGANPVSVEWSAPELQGAIGRGHFSGPFNGSFAGEHRLEQSLPDGSPHGEWLLQIERVGSVLEIAWKRGEAVHFRGLGLETPSGIAVGWYPDLRQLAFMGYRAHLGQSGKTGDIM